MLVKQFSMSAVLLLLVTLDDEARAVLTTPIGAGLIAGGVVMNACGGWWMRRIIAGSAP